MLDLEYFIAGKYICNSCMEDQHGQHTASILFSIMHYFGNLTELLQTASKVIRLFVMLHHRIMMLLSLLPKQVTLH